MYFSQVWTPVYGHLCNEKALGLVSAAQDIFFHNLNPSMKCQDAWPFAGTFHIQACIVRARDAERGRLISKHAMSVCRMKNQGRPSAQNHEGFKGKQSHSGAMQRPSRHIRNQSSWLSKRLQRLMLRSTMLCSQLKSTLVLLATN